MSLPPLTKGHIYSYNHKGWSFVGIYERLSDEGSYYFQYLFHVNYSSTWTIPYFTCDRFDRLTHIGSPTNFPEYLL